MKKLCVVILSLITSVCNSQELMTIREIFDFNIGDKFYYKVEVLPEDIMPFPEYYRYQIISKEIDDEGDSIVYDQVETHYWCSTPPDRYSSNTRTQNLKFINIDSTFQYYDNLFLYDTSNIDTLCTSYLRDTIFQSTEYQCNRLVNGVEYYWSCFEFGQYINYYGQGLGLIYSSSHDYDMGPYFQYERLYYYKKGQQECGTDYFPTSIDYTFQDIFTVYPNPTHDKIYIQGYINTDKLIAKIFDLQGRLVKSIKSKSGVSIIDMSDLSCGSYILGLSLNDNWTTRLINKQ